MKTLSVTPTLAKISMTPEEQMLIMSAMTQPAASTWGQPVSPHHHRLIGLEAAQMKDGLYFHKDEITEWVKALNDFETDNRKTLAFSEKLALACHDAVCDMKDMTFAQGVTTMTLQGKKHTFEIEVCTGEQHKDFAFPATSSAQDVVAQLIANNRSVDDMKAVTISLRYEDPATKAVTMIAGGSVMDFTNNLFRSIDTEAWRASVESRTMRGGQIPFETFHKNYVKRHPLGGFRSHLLNFTAYSGHAPSPLVMRANEVDGRILPTKDAAAPWISIGFKSVSQHDTALDAIKEAYSEVQTVRALMFVDENAYGCGYGRPDLEALTESLQNTISDSLTKLDAHLAFDRTMDDGDVSTDPNVTGHRQFALLEEFREARDAERRNDAEYACP